jgi:hypothetical protein
MVPEEEGEVRQGIHRHVRLRVGIQDGYIVAVEWHKGDEVLRPSITGTLPIVQETEDIQT